MALCSVYIRNLTWITNIADQEDPVFYLTYRRRPPIIITRGRQDDSFAVWNKDGVHGVGNIQAITEFSSLSLLFSSYGVRLGHSTIASLYDNIQKFSKSAPKKYVAIELKNFEVLEEHPSYLECLPRHLHNRPISNGLNYVYCADEELLQPTSRQVTRTFTQRIGQSAFNRVISSAYHNRCAISGMEIEYGHACHIISVRDGGKHSASNGIYLSPTAHAYFDNGLVKFDKNNRIFVSEKVQDEALRKVVLNDGGTLQLPNDKKYCPVFQSRHMVD